jgi:hypothetical protein
VKPSSWRSRFISEDIRPAYFVRQLVAVADTGSCSRAAEELNRARPHGRQVDMHE